MNMNFVPAARDVLTGGPHVVFDVAGAENTARINVFEAGKNFLGISFRHVSNYIEPAAMAHAHDELFSAEA